LRVVRAIQAACEKEPVMNTHFHGASLSKQLRKDINLAMAVDTKAGLYAPVIKDIASKDDATVRSEINAFKEHAKKQDFPADMLHDATITLSNFGVFAGRYANPIVVPPTVTIIGVGKLRDDVVAVDGKPDVHRMMPISVTFDHRAVTGGEAARFLRALIESLSQE